LGATTIKRQSNVGTEFALDCCIERARLYSPQLMYARLVRYNHKDSASFFDSHQFSCPARVGGELRIGAMEEYRAYVLDAEGHVKDLIEFLAANDQAALAHARQYLGIVPIPRSA